MRRGGGRSTYLPLVGRGNEEAVDDGGEAGLQGELRVGRPVVRGPGGTGPQLSGARPPGQRYRAHIVRGPGHMPRGAHPDTLRVVLPHPGAAGVGLPLEPGPGVRDCQPASPPSPPPAAHSLCTACVLSHASHLRAAGREDVSRSDSDSVNALTDGVTTVTTQ